MKKQKEKHKEEREWKIEALSDWVEDMESHYIEIWKASEYIQDGKLRVMVSKAESAYHELKEHLQDMVEDIWDSRNDSTSNQGKKRKGNHD